MRFTLPGSPVKKVHQPGMILPPKQTLQLVQPSFAKRYLMNAMFAKAWAVAVVME